MRAIIIDDKDAKALLDRLKLESFRKDAPGYGIEQSEAWNALPQNLRDSLIRDMHKRFHYILCCWLQDQGASTI